VLHVDGYAGFERLRARGNVVLAACWAHTRRYFYEFFEANGSSVAAEALRRIGELYAIEERIRGQSRRIDWPNGWRPPSRRRQSEALAGTTARPRAGPRQARRSDPLCVVALARPSRFLHDGRIELDTNSVARDSSCCTWQKESSVCGIG
jgi:transposase